MLAAIGGPLILKAYHMDISISTLQVIAVRGVRLQQDILHIEKCLSGKHLVVIFTRKSPNRW
jgi:hypothetical protein